MKIQIIQLEKHDDAISARDKIAWCKAPRILLVWPRNSCILSRQLDLVLLERFSATQGAQLGLVTRDGEIVTIAVELGIPTFNSIAQARRSYWRHNRSPRRFPEAGKGSQELRQISGKVKPGLSFWMTLPTTRIASFVIGLLAVAALLLAFVPGAVVKIKPESRVQQVTIPLLASSKVIAVNLNGNLPLRQTSLEVEGTDSLPATGTTETGTQSASGSVQFTNLTDQPQEIPSGTVVLASGHTGIRFATTRAGKLLAGPATTVIIPVQALTPGQDANLWANEIDSIDGALGLSLAVTNLRPIMGGANQSIAAASASDLNQLKTRLTQTLLQKAQTQLDSLISPGDELVAATLKVVNVLDEQHFPEVGQPGNELSLSLRLEVSEDYIAKNDLTSLATAGLEANLPAGYHSVDDKIDIVMGKDGQIDADGDVHWQIQAQRILQRTIDPDQVFTLIAGMLPGEASQRLVKNLQLQSRPEIALFPAWWPRLPVLSFRIALNFSGAN